MKMKEVRAINATSPKAVPKGMRDAIAITLGGSFRRVYVPRNTRQAKADAPWHGFV